MARPSLSPVPGPANIKFKCSICGTRTWATIATGRLHQHTPRGSSERCKGSRRLVFKPAQPDKKVDDPATPSDFDWYSKKPLTIKPAQLTPADIKTAQRLVKATTVDPKRYGYMRQPLRRFIDHARANRPDLFTRPQSMRTARRGPAPIAAAADPSKTLGKPRTEPRRKVWYREILVGKRN